MQFYHEDLKKVIGNVFNMDPNIVAEDASIDTVSNWDSLGHLNLVLALEERFNVTLTEEETVEILNYNLIRMVLEKHGIVFADNQ